MKLLKTLKKFWRQRDSVFIETKERSFPPQNAPKEQKLARTVDQHLVLRSKDLLQMTEKLVNKGEYLRAEQLIKDGVTDLADNPEIWWLLLKIAEELGRVGRVFFCLEKLLTFEPEATELLEKKEKLQTTLDKRLDYFIEYKLAPEFYKLV